MLAPVLHPLVLARLMSGLAAALLVTAALRVAWRVLRSDSERRGQAPGDAGASEAQIANERQAELVASLVQVALAIAALGLVLTVLAADGLSDSIRGAMCAWGVFSSTRAGFAALGTSAVATVACALWLVVHRLDLRLLRPTLTRDKLAATFALAPLLWLDLGLTWTFFAQLDLSAVASCCSSSLDPGVGHVFGASGGPRFLAFGVALALGLAAAASALLTRRCGWSPPWTMPNMALPGWLPKAALQRSAQRTDISMARSMSFGSAGSATHSSSCIWMSESSRPWISIERSGDM